MKKNILIFLAFFTALTVYADNVPKIFQLEWGSSFSTVQNNLIKNNTGLSRLEYYAIIPGISELDSLKTSASVKYISKGSPFFDIESEVIFTFYNSNNTQNGLKLSKIEVYMKNKDIYNKWVYTTSVFRNLITLFCENYKVRLSRDEEKWVFQNYNYEVTINGVYAEFLANVGNDRLARDESIYFSYENNDIQNAMLRKEIEIEKMKDSNSREESQDSEIDTIKRNL